MDLNLICFRLLQRSYRRLMKVEVQNILSGLKDLEVIIQMKDQTD